jgi:two-component system invasion response regulator UvrY
MIKIAIADDHALFRKGIIKLLDPDRFQLLFDVPNGKALIGKIMEGEALVPDVIIMDIEMPGMNGYETVAWLKANHPFIKVLVVSMVDKEESLVRMMQLGVKGYLSKIMEPEDLYAALKAIVNGEYYFTDIATNKLIHYIQKSDTMPEGRTGMLLAHELWSSLNVGQKTFITHACTEMTYEEIADIMCLSPKTIDKYRDAVFEKFDVKNRVGLVLYAIKNGIVTIG